MMQRQPFRLTIHPDDKAHLFQALLEVKKKNHYAVSVGRRIKRWARYTGEATGVTTPVDLKAEWERCISVAEQTNPQTIFEFWKVFAKEARYRFYVDPWGGHGAPQAQQQLSFGIHTSLIKSLFAQFENEPDIHVCSEKLFSSVVNPTCIFWDRIDTHTFDARVRESWAAFHRLMVCSKEYYALHTSLLTSVGFNENDFITSFLSGHPLAKTSIQQNHPIFSRDILTLIAIHLSPADLFHFRQVSHHAYNAVEYTTTARLKQRLHVIEQNKLLKELIGPVFYMNEHFLISNPEASIGRYRYRVTTLQPTFTSRTFHGKQGQFHKMIGAHAQQDETGALTILTAYDQNYNSSCIIYRLRIADINAPYAVNDIAELVIHHPEKQCDNYGSGKPIWKRFANITTDSGNVRIKLQFDEMAGIKEEYQFHLKFKKTGQTEHHQAEFAMSDFDTGNINIVTTELHPMAYK